ncbi:MAG: hypothetical protein ACHQIG_13455 [Acidimicrobiia bacterium]
MAVAPRLTWSRASGRDELRVDGLASADLARFQALPPDAIARELPVFASELLDDHGGARVAPVLAHRLAPMHGEYRCDADGVSFTPRHPLLRGRSYTAVLGVEQLSVCLPAPDAGPSATVVAVHPSGSAVPRNLLRCYLEFSAPMSEGEAQRCVTVVDTSGAPLTGALLDMDPELWDPQRRRLTVFFDPARLKRGLAPHRDAGYPLRDGETVALVIDATMRDARGQPLGAEVRHAFAVGPDVRARVEPTAWRLEPVTAGSRDALVVEFDRTLDHALLAHCLIVVDAHGAHVRGVATPERDDTAWAFVPDAPWDATPHDLVVDPILEDVCGNSVTRVFDRDLSDSAHARGPGHLVAVPFTPG